MKPANVLISENGLLKLDVCDISLQLEDNGSKRQRVDDSSLFRAPELCAGMYCCKSDIWCIGMSVMKMMEGRRPVMNNRKAIEEPYSLCGWSYDLIDFVSHCLVRDVEKRASVSELLEVSILSKDDE